jgi:hypothetical protein
LINKRGKWVKATLPSVNNSVLGVAFNS